MTGYLYTLLDCPVCESAKGILRMKGWEWLEVPIDNPILEYGIQCLFKDRKVHAPVFVLPTEGIFIFLPQSEDTAVLARVISLKSENPGVLAEPEPVTATS